MALRPERWTIFAKFPIRLRDMVLVGTVMALINTGTVYTSALADQNPIPFHLPLIWELTGFYTILPLFYLTFWFASRFPFVRGKRLKHFLPHLLACMVFSGLHSTAMYVSRNLIYYVLDWGAYDYGILFYKYLMEFHKDIIVYWAFIGILALYNYIRANREREIESARVETRLQRARLDALKNQLDPHFLFNTLNTISSAMYDDVKAADKMISNLSRLLRLSLDYSDTQETTLREELKFLDLYVSIMQARFGDKLKVFYHIGSDLDEALVPNLVLQPLVENAIKHNEPEGDKMAEIQVSVDRVDQGLELCVRDNGPGIGDDFQVVEGKGVGLSNTLARLKHLYGEQHQVSFQNRTDGGLEVCLVFPYKTQPRQALTTEAVAECR